MKRTALAIAAGALTLSAYPAHRKLRRSPGLPWPSPRATLSLKCSINIGINPGHGGIILGAGEPMAAGIAATGKKKYSHSRPIAPSKARLGNRVDNTIWRLPGVAFGLKTRQSGAAPSFSARRFVCR